MVTSITEELVSILPKYALLVIMHSLFIHPLTYLIDISVN